MKVSNQIDVIPVILIGVLLVGAVISLGLIAGIDENILGIAVPAIMVVFGYIAVHFFELNRKLYNKKLDTYYAVVYGIQALQKITDPTAMPAAVEAFESKVYQVWLVVPSHVYTVLIAYIRALNVWSSQPNTDTAAQRERAFQQVMKQIRAEVVRDYTVQFDHQLFR